MPGDARSSAPRRAFWNATPPIMAAANIIVRAQILPFFTAREMVVISRMPSSAMPSATGKLSTQNVSNSVKASTPVAAVSRR